MMDLELIAGYTMEDKTNSATFESKALIIKNLLEEQS